MIELIIDDEFKTCTICNEKYPATEEYFYKQLYRTKTKGTFYKLTQCKKCVSKKNKENSKENYQKNKEYRKRNPEPSKRAIKKYHAKNQDKVKNIAKEWRENNPDKVSEYNKERRLHKKHRISKNEWENCKNYFNYRCAYCGLPIEDHYIQFRGEIRLGDFHKEHVNHEGENDLTNCVPSCKNCNSSKHDSELSKWYNEDNPVYSISRLEKIIKWLSEDYKLYIR